MNLKVLLCISVCLFSNGIVLAQTYTTPNILTTPGSGGFLEDGSGSFSPGSSSLDFEVTVDPINLTMTLDEVIGNLILPQVQNTQFYTTGFTTVTSVTTTINFDPLSFTLLPNLSQAISPIDGNPVPLYSTAYYEYQDSDPLTLTGNYTVTGPTQSTSGTFSIPIIGGFYITYGTLETAAYPNSLVFDSNDALFALAGSSTLFTATVDGQVIAPSAGIDAGASGSIPLEAAEPSALYLLILSIITLFLFYPVMSQFSSCPAKRMNK